MSCNATPDNPCFCHCHTIEDKDGYPLTGSTCDKCPVFKERKSQSSVTDKESR